MARNLPQLQISAKYLGINFDSKLIFNHHVNSVCQKANNTLAFLCRNLRYCITEKFDTLISLRRSLASEFADELTKKFQLGYLEAPSQAKRWLQEQQDLDNMYSIFLQVPMV